jgi:hypothetical protein
MVLITIEWWFDCKGIYIFGHWINDCSCCRLFVFWNTKSAGAKIKHFVKLTYHERQNSTSFIICFAWISKYIVIFTVAMQIQTDCDTKLIIYFYDFIFNTPNLRVKLLYRVFPISIQIDASNIASKITIDYSIHIDHWEYFKNEII